MARMALFSALTVFAVLTGCSGGGDDGPAYPIADQPLQGMINGESWTFGSGITNAFLSSGEDEYFTELYAESVGCNDFPPSTNHLIANVPKEPGEYRFTNFLNMTFVFSDGGTTYNNVALTGRIETVAIVGTSLTAGLHGVFDGDPGFEVDGQFTATICPD